MVPALIVNEFAEAAVEAVPAANTMSPMPTVPLAETLAAMVSENDPVAEHP